jgi:hypothetical protein
LLFQADSKLEQGICTTSQTQLLFRSTTVIMRPDTGFRFLDLPPELRNRTYSLCIYTSTARLANISYEMPRDPRKAGFFQLAHVSRLIRTEFLPLYMAKLSKQGIRLQDISAYVRDFLQPQVIATKVITIDISIKARCDVLNLLKYCREHGTVLQFTSEEYLHLKRSIARAQSTLRQLIPSLSTSNGKRWSKYLDEVVQAILFSPEFPHVAWITVRRDGIIPDDCYHNWDERRRQKDLWKQRSGFLIEFGYIRASLKHERRRT